MTSIDRTASGRQPAAISRRALLVVFSLVAAAACAQDVEEAAAPGPEEAGGGAVVEEAADPAAGLMRPAAPEGDLAPIARDPFWPVGFDPAPPAATPAPTPAPVPRPEVRQPPVRQPEPAAADWAAARRQLTPTVGRSVGPDGQERFFTILNNRLVNAGQTVSVATPVFTFTWRVSRITETGVEFLPLEARRLSDGQRFPAAVAETE